MAEDITNEKNFARLSKLKKLLTCLAEKTISHMKNDWDQFDFLDCKIEQKISAFKKSSIEKTSNLIMDLNINLKNTIKSITNLEEKWSEFLNTPNISPLEASLSKIFKSKIDFPELDQKYQTQKCPATLKITPNGKYVSEKIDKNANICSEKVLKQKKNENNHTKTSNFSSKTDVLISGLNKFIGVEELLEFFRDSHPGIVHIPKVLGGKKKGFAIITFPTYEDALNASKLDSKKLLGSIVNVQIIPNQNAELKTKQNYTIHIQNINFHTSDHSISRAFKRNKISVECMRIPRHKSGQNKGFGFVVLSSKCDFERALELNDMEVEGRKLRIEVAR